MHSLAFESVCWYDKRCHNPKGSQHSFDITQSFRLYSIRIGYVVIYKPFSEMKEECLVRLRRSITCVSRVIININCIDDMKKRYTIANLGSQFTSKMAETLSRVRHMGISRVFHSSPLCSHLLFHLLLCVYLLVKHFFQTFSIIHQTLPTTSWRIDCIRNEKLRWYSIPKRTECEENYYGHAIPVIEWDT